MTPRELAQTLLDSFGHGNPNRRYGPRLIDPNGKKNFGRNLLKGASKYMPHQGECEKARRRRQIAKELAKAEAAQ